MNSYATYRYLPPSPGATRLGDANNVEIVLQRTVRHEGKTIDADEVPKTFFLDRASLKQMAELLDMQPRPLGVPAWRQ